MKDILIQNIYTYNKTNKIPKYKINDLVRISLKRRDVFDKPSGNIKWSEELFKIYDINISNVIMNKLKDMNDEIIGGFYEKELEKTKNTSGEYIVEKIIKTKNDKLFVKWRNYSSNQKPGTLYACTLLYIHCTYSSIDLSLSFNFIF